MIFCSFIVKTFSQAFFVFFETISGILLIVLLIIISFSVIVFSSYSTDQICCDLNALSGCALAKNLVGLSILLFCISSTLLLINSLITFFFLSSIFFLISWIFLFIFLPGFHLVKVYLLKYQFYIHPYFPN
jgi:hypothetical protein